MFIIGFIVRYVIGFGLIFGLKYQFGFEITTFNLFVILPIGALIMGYILGGGMPKVLKKFNSRGSKMTTSIQLIAGLIIFALIQFGFYQMTYVNEDGLNYQFEGAHISEFDVFGTDEPFTFISFTKTNVNAKSFNLSYKGRTNLLSLDGVKTINWFFFGLDFLAFYFAFYVAYGVVVDAAFCESCKKYMKSKSVFDLYDESTNAVDVLRNAASDDDFETLNAVINDKTEKKIKFIRIKGELKYCEECYKGELKIKVYHKNEKDKFVHQSKLDETIMINRNHVNQLVS